jgi:CelD/BcsL family acetyltransferase involved in cellulose biosynthesis/predicted ATP-grasp superfamily ATP-dependent carboligase
MRVLVTDGDNRAALAVVRSLGRAGHTVIVGEKRSPSLAQTSRYCAHRLNYPDPVKTPDVFVEYVAGYARSNPIDAILPVSDITTLLLTAERGRLAATCAIPFAPAATIQRAADKIDMLQTAQRLGVPVPHTVIVPSPFEVPDHDLGYPVVIKPWRSRIRVATGWVSTSVSYARTAAELEHDLASRPAHEFPVMLQERIIGSGIGVFACYHHGKTVALFSHRRLRERPPWGGVSVLSESVALPPLATAYATRLLDEIGWHGVAMVEFKNDRSDGQPKLMEVNGRFWGSLQLAIEAGVDFPRLLLQTLEPRGFNGLPTYRVGVKSRWLWGDFDSLLQTWSRNEAGPGLPASRWQSLREFVRFWDPAVHYDNPKWHDPQPGLFETSSRVRSAVGALVTKSARTVPSRPHRRAASIVSSGLRVAVADSPEARELCEHEWNALAAQNETNSVFQTHQWARSWWSSFRDQHQSKLITVRDADGLVGLVPLVLNQSTREGVVNFLGDARADYCDVLARRDKSAILKPVIDMLREDDCWNVIELNNIPAASQTVSVVKELCERNGFFAVAGTHYPCPALVIAGHEAQAAAIMNKESLRRKENALRRTGVLTFRDFTLAADIEPLLDAFFDQHIARWSPSATPSLFEHPRNRDFYRKLTREMAPAGWLAFSVVEFDGAPIAFHYGFDYNGSLLWYKPSFDPSIAARSPGMVLVRHLIRSAVEKGRRELDFTVGDEPFKKRFTNVVRQTANIHIYRDRTRYLYERSKRQLTAAVKTRT